MRAACTIAVGVVLGAVSLATACDDDTVDAGAMDGATLADAGLGDDAGVAPAALEARLLIEHDAAGDATGVQLFFHGAPWRRLTVTGPDGDVLDVEALGKVGALGLTEMLARSDAPPAAETPRSEVLALFPEGDYAFSAESVGGEPFTATATLTHDLPASPEITAPAADASVDPGSPILVAWTAVGLSLDGGPIDLEGYRVIVERDVRIPEGEGFEPLVLDAVVPSAVTSFPVPAEYLRPGTPYVIEVRALEASGNQTIAATTFETTGAPIDDLTEAPERRSTDLDATKLLIEHAATDEDTGFRIVLRGEPWSPASVRGAEGLLEVRPRGNLASLGLTETLFATSEPSADELPLATVLSLLPEGEYDFTADAIDGPVMVGAATLSHTIPRPTTIASPAEAASVDSERPLEVIWSSVAESLTGAPIDVVGYQLVVASDEPALPAPGSSRPVFGVRVPADTTSVTVPAELLEEGTAYVIEVLAREETGNQTIASARFETSPSETG